MQRVGALPGRAVYACRLKAQAVNGSGARSELQDSGGGNCKGAVSHVKTLLAARLASRFLTPPMVSRDAGKFADHRIPCVRRISKALERSEGSGEGLQLCDAGNRSVLKLPG